MGNVFKADYIWQVTVPTIQPEIFPCPVNAFG
jgi:hypothetical protein